MFKRCKVVMLPTNQKATIVVNPTTKQVQYNTPSKDAKYYTDAGFEVYDLYIISNEEIKEGDWFYDERDGIISNQSLSRTMFSKKIITTTDSSIVLPNRFPSFTYLPRPSSAFIQKYISEYNKGRVIDEVMVEYVVVNDVQVDYILKVDKNNCITIRPIKDSWNREEVIALLNKLDNDSANPLGKTFLKQWIEDNL